MISRGCFALILICAAALTGVASAQQYRWVDAKGSTQFGDVPPPGARSIQKMTAAPPSRADSPALPFELVRLQKDFPVTLYTAPHCKEGCERARALLNKRGVPFKEVLVWQEDTNEELKRISGGTEVPTMVVGRSFERGFEPTAFDALLDSAGYPKAGALPVRAQKAPGAPEGFVAPDGAPQAKSATSPETTKRAGPYDSSGLTGPAPKPGQYDPSGLTGPPPKPGQYGVPGESK